MKLMIKKVNYKNQTFSCLVGKQLVNFYLTNRLSKIFLNYLSKDVLVEFVVSGKTKKIDKRKAYEVSHFTLIKNYKNDITIYDHSQLKQEMIDFLENNKYYLFLDLEMTIPFYRQRDFIPEVIQYGYLLVDNKGNTITENSNYVKAKLQKNINRRTIRFLKLDINYYNNTKIPFTSFYKELKEMIDKYQPKIVVWGKNDIQALNYGYKIHKLKALTNELDFVDLLKLHKDYFNLRNDLGLFKAYETYYNKSINQTHDAKDDAKVTKKVFEAFLKYSNIEFNSLKE